MVNGRKEYVRRWVIAGYVAVFLLVAVTFVYVAELLLRVSQEGRDVNVPHEKARIITGTLLQLYEYETEVLFALTAGDVRTVSGNLSHKFNEVFDLLNRLREFPTDSVACEGIDRIQGLLLMKERNIYRLMEVRKDMDVFYAQSFEDELKRKRKAIVTPSVIKEETRATTDTLVIHRPKKGFFKRLAEVFTPVKEDTATLTNTIVSQKIDSTMNVYDPNLAVAEALIKLQNCIAVRRDTNNVQFRLQAAELLHNNNVITAEISRILVSIKEEESRLGDERELQKRGFVARSVCELSVIAAVCFGVIIFFLIIILTEISKARRLRHEVDMARRIAEDLLYARERIMLMISHDIRAPLASILSSIDMLKQEAMTAVQAEHVENMLTSSRHTLLLVNELLDFHCLDSGKMEIRPSAFNAVELFEEIHASYKPLADAKKLRLTLSIEGAEDEEVRYIGDTVRIKQAAGNLLSNAIKFTPRGNVCLGVRIVHEQVGKLIYISVKDEGPGISSSDRDRIFHEFARLEGAQSEKGFGLGLSIAAKLVELMHGTISLTSEPGKGAEFVICLPLEVAPPVETVNVPAGMTVDIDGRKVNSMVIDDDVVQLKYIESLLRRNHINVITTADPNEALSLLRVAAIDVVFIDIINPVMDGIELIKCIRTSGIPSAATLPVVAMSAGLAKQEIHYIKEGFTAFLGKPITPDSLSKILNGIFPHSGRTNGIGGAYNFSSLTSFAADADAARTILFTFIEQSQASMSVLRSASTRHDRASASRAAHKLTPTMEMLGASELTALLSTIENNDAALSEDEWAATVNRCAQMIEDIIAEAQSVE